MNRSNESELQRALRSLRNQHISVEEVQGPPDGFGFFLSPIGIVLTAPQILKLIADGELNSQGIRTFANKEKQLVEEDIEAAEGRVPPDQFRTWTAAKITDYINEEFGRVHSIRQVTDVLNRLDVKYKRV